MPNHVENTLKVSGKPVELKEFQIFAQKGHEVFSIQNLFPMPKELEETQSPPEITKGIEYIRALKQWNIDKAAKPGIVSGKPLTQKMSDELIDKYGANNWYDWAIENWGTKWGSYDSHIEKKGKTYIKYFFLSAWNPPTNALIKISENYPNLIFELKYIEEGNGIKGKLSIHGGQMEILQDIVSHF